jgi:hypothetical protein
LDDEAGIVARRNGFFDTLVVPGRASVVVTTTLEEFRRTGRSS